MRAVLGFLRRLFWHNLPLKALSVMLAVALVVVKFEDKPSDIVLTIPVNVTHPDNKVLTSPLITKVKVTIKGRYGLLRKLDRERPKSLNVTLSGDEEAQVTFDPRTIELPPELTVVAINPPAMLVQLDDRVEATLPLKVDLEGAPKPGFRTVETRVEPAVVKVSGAARAVAALKAVTTERVSLVGRSQTARLDVRLAPPPEHVQYRTETERFSVTLGIEEIQETRAFSDVPILVINTIEDGPEYEAAPGRVQLSLFGPLRMLDAIDANDLQPRVEVSVRAPGRPTIKDRPVQFEAPAGLTLTQSDLPKVTLVRREPLPEPPPIPVPLGPVVPFGPVAPVGPGGPAGLLAPIGPGGPLVPLDLVGPPAPGEAVPRRVAPDGADRGQDGAGAGGAGAEGAGAGGAGAGGAAGPAANGSAYDLLGALLRATEGVDPRNLEPAAATDGPTTGGHGLEPGGGAGPEHGAEGAPPGALDPAPEAAHARSDDEGGGAQARGAGDGAGVSESVP